MEGGSKDHTCIFVCLSVPPTLLHLHNFHIALLQAGDFEQYVTLCVAFMVMSGARTEGVPHPKWAMKVGCVWGPQKNHKGEVVAEYADDKFCWSTGCTWERYEKFEAGDLKDCEASQKALRDFERWYADSKYGDQDEEVFRTLQGAPISQGEG